MTELKLKPCPFCGGKAKLYVSEGGVCVMCTEGFSKECGCRTGWYADNTHPDGMSAWRKAEKTATELAIEAWNRRVKE